MFPKRICPRTIGGRKVHTAPDRTVLALYHRNFDGHFTGFTNRSHRLYHHTVKQVRFCQILARGSDFIGIEFLPRAPAAISGNKIRVDFLGPFYLDRAKIGLCASIKCICHRQGLFGRIGNHPAIPGLGQRITILAQHIDTKLFGQNDRVCTRTLPDFQMDLFKLRIRCRALDHLIRIGGFKRHPIKQIRRSRINVIGQDNRFGGI